MHILCLFIYSDCLELLQKKASHLMQNFMISSNKPDDVPHPAKDSQVPTISLEKRGTKYHFIWLIPLCCT